MKLGYIKAVLGLTDHTIWILLKEDSILSISPPTSLVLEMPCLTWVKTEIKQSPKEGNYLLSSH